MRLLAPRAELRLLLTGGSGLVDSTRLSFLGEALRALLVMEARGLQVRRRRSGWGRCGVGWGVKDDGVQKGRAWG